MQECLSVWAKETACGIDDGFVGEERAGGRGVVDGALTRKKVPPLLWLLDCMMD